MTDIDETIRRVPDLIARVRELDAAATKGPWEGDHYCVKVQGGRGPGYPPSRDAIASLFDGEYIENPRAQDDAALIAYYRTAAPQLAVECERLQTELEMIRDAAADAIRDGEQVAFTVRTLHVLRTVLRGSE